MLKGAGQQQAREDTEIPKEAWEVSDAKSYSVLLDTPQYVEMKEKLLHVPFPPAENHFLLQSTLVLVLLACL